MTLRLQELLAAVDGRPTTASYQQASRQLDGLGELRPVKVALLSSFTIDPVLPFLRVEAARHGFAAQVYVAPFNGVNQELLTPDSGCVRHAPDVIFVTERLADVAPLLADDYLSLDPAAVETVIDGIVTMTSSAIAAFRGRSTAAVVVGNFAPVVNPALGIHEPMATGSQTDAIRRLNARLAIALRGIAGVHVLDIERLSAEVGQRAWYDAKMWHLARAPIAAAGLLALGKRQATFLRALLAPPRKCLVLDLDDTLWGGVLGEAGVQGVKLGTTYPGSAYREFQQALLQLHRRGILLAINSKNNQGEVDELFRSHPDMVLRREHFASVQVNWGPKPQNMLKIARELDLGIDSLVFFDDNPVECALMREALPEVLTIQAPTDPLEYSAAVFNHAAFERLAFTNEDQRRGQIYQEQAERRAEAHSAASLDDFLAGLRMTAEIESVDEFAFSRVVDLLTKTNQFNVTTRRHSAAQLRALLADPDCEAFYLRLTDRFGDNGIVGFAIIDFDSDAAVIDTFLLSCRVIGRAAETALLAFLLERAQRRGKAVLEGVFIATAKNAPAADFFVRHGFEKTGDDGSTSRWRLRIDQAPFAWPAFIAPGATAARESR